MTYLPRGHHIPKPEGATDLELQAISLAMAESGIKSAQEYMCRTQEGTDAFMKASLYITFGEWE